MDQPYNNNDDDNDNKNNGDLYSPLTKISITRFTIAIQIQTLLKRDSITIATKHVTITTVFDYVPSDNSHITLYRSQSKMFNPGVLLLCMSR